MDAPASPKKGSNLAKLDLQRIPMFGCVSNNYLPVGKEGKKPSRRRTSSSPV
jgi:hypothetical protein